MAFYSISPKITKRYFLICFMKISQISRSVGILGTSVEMLFHFD